MILILVLFQPFFDLLIFVMTLMLLIPLNREMKVEMFHHLLLVMVENPKHLEIIEKTNEIIFVEYIIIT
jgi:flagellar biosynthesis regulator FlbT